VTALNGLATAALCLAGATLLVLTAAGLFAPPPPPRRDWYGELAGRAGLDAPWITTPH
jgi:hypothetical protein